jgi:uncharacterized GH25 family protein
MRFTKFALLATAVVPSLALGGQIDGTVFKNGQPVGNGDIRIRCEPNVSESRTTDLQGTFSFYVEQSGICSFEVVDLKAAEDKRIVAAHRVYSYQYPVRYDFDLVPQPGGGYSLRRR